MLDINNIVFITGNQESEKENAALNGGLFSLVSGELWFLA